MISEKGSELAEVENRIPRSVLLGGLIGAGVGLLAAYLFLQRDEKGQPPEFTVGDGVKIGVLVFGLLKSIANL